MCLQQARPASVTSAPTPKPAPAIFSLRDLLAWELPPVRWAVPEILPEGLTLLAGKPKLGKSWLALSLALSIASGGVALGKQPVTQGEVLYLALEENARRLQARARQLLAWMTEAPAGLDFALDWPRLAEGGLSCLEEYLRTHPNTRLVVIDTWAKVAPRTDTRRCTQYEGDYDALTPLKRLADTYHVSILAVHHLRKTGAADVLDEITGSTGMTGAVDGTLILKRDRGQLDATLFVTGRDVEREQELALRFEVEAAQWRLLGSAEGVGRTRARREILDLLREPSAQPEGMRPRDIAGALEKNYHTTRALLGKMVESGEVTRIGGRYSALPVPSDHKQQKQGEGTWQPGMALSGNSGTPCSALPLRDDADNEKQNGKTRSTSESETATHGKVEIDYADYGDGADATEVDSAIDSSLVAARGMQEQQQMDEGQGNFRSPERSEDERQRDFATVRSTTGNENQQCHQHHPRNQRNQSHHNNTLAAGAEEEEVDDSASQACRDRCPHHPRERLVRFDPAGQAWCDRLDCWDCYRLMKLGETLGYGSLTDRGGQHLIDEGKEAWSAFVLSQRPFLIVVATEAAVTQCKALGLDVPDLSSEVKQPVKLPPLSP